MRDEKGKGERTGREKEKEKEAAPHVPGKSPSPVLMWPATA